MSDLISLVWSDDLELTFRKTIYLMQHQTTNRGLLIDLDRWIQIMMSHVLGVRWLCHWPHTDLWVTEPCGEGRGVGQALGDYERSQSPIRVLAVTRK